MRLSTALSTVSGIFSYESYQDVDLFGFITQFWRLGTRLGTHREKGAPGCDLYGLWSGGEPSGSLTGPSPTLEATGNAPPPTPSSARVF